MRFTDKAASSSLNTPGGLSPALIGKVVTVQVFRKKENHILPETLTKFVGVLKAYALDTNGMRFTLDGCKETPVFYTHATVEFILHEGS